MIWYDMIVYYSYLPARVLFFPEGSILQVSIFFSCKWLAMTACVWSVYMYVYTCLCMNVCICVCMYVCMYVCAYMYRWMYACMNVRVHACMYVCMYECTCACMYVRAHTSGWYNELGVHKCQFITYCHILCVHRAVSS